MKRKLNINKLKDRKHINISSEEALEDIVPFNWSKDVLEGKKTITIK